MAIRATPNKLADMQARLKDKLAKGIIITNSPQYRRLKAIITAYEFRLENDPII